MRCTAQLDNNCIAIHCQVKNANVVDFFFEVVKMQIMSKTTQLSIRMTEDIRRDLHAELSPDPDDLVFPVKCFKRSWRTLCKSVRVEGIWMRDFRHYRNHQLMLDPRVNDVERMLWMGHKQLPTNARYGKLDKSFIEKFTSSAS